MISKNRDNKIKEFIIFMGPTLVTFTSVLLIPLIYGFYLTFTKYSPIKGIEGFVGLKNYLDAFSDAEFISQFIKTMGYVFIATILCNLVAFFLAYILTSNIKTQNFLRAGFFTPNLIGGIVLGYIWKFIFSNVFTVIGTKLKYEPMMTSFLTDPNKALFAMIIVSIWQYAGYLMMIYIAGFVGMPKDVLEAADVDGATAIKKFFGIKIPLMISSFIVCFFISISRFFMTYDLNLALTGGGPYGSTQLASMHIYQKAFQSNKYALGQAEAMILFVVVAIVAVSQVLLMKRYEVEE